ncbi:asparaginase [Natronococcus sp. A-GB7]|uniref:asparaginase n=1 Tax=Natronococcus sp. A-GB7 TaxID=3037649 RepID=UPI00241F1719|nr:asparaginase [Natronococcus sp. A-GB7]MDG5819773.1 asparaginase [Natronococcus sp. A-GB7]
MEKRLRGEGGSIMPNRRTFLQLTGAAAGSGFMFASSTAASDQVENAELPDYEDRPEVRVVGTGGTIASTQEAAEDGGYSLDEQAEAIVDAVPVLDDFAEITFDQPVQKPSPFLNAEDFVEISKAIMDAAREGVDGILVTHGTDAIEENAFFQDLVLDLDIPVVFVGAMRPADAISADGPANLLSAVRLCTREEFHLADEPSGVYMVMNDTIHAARDVRKSHTSMVDTFESGPAGPIGILTDSEIVLYREPGSYTADLSCENLDEVPNKTVPIADTGAGYDPFIFEQATAGEYDVDGIVLHTTGNGGVQPPITEARDKALEAGIPVTASTRVYWGPMSSGPTPADEEGSLVTMEDIPAWNARLLMMVALTALEDEPAIEAVRQAVYESKYASETVSPSAL